MYDSTDSVTRHKASDHLKTNIASGSHQQGCHWVLTRLFCVHPESVKHWDAKVDLICRCNAYLFGNRSQGTTQSGFTLTPWQLRDNSGRSVKWFTYIVQRFIGH
ncbi:hypothetical protein QMY54_00430 (plasmid) [Pseudomonas rhodesiae]|nr:hypothetical protein QMY54_00430 [Pseudomonas rhodesiae]